MRRADALAEGSVELAQAMVPQAGARARARGRWWLSVGGCEAGAVGRIC